MTSLRDAPSILSRRHYPHRPNANSSRLLMTASHSSRTSCRTLFLPYFLSAIISALPGLTQTVTFASPSSTIALPTSQTPIFSSSLSPPSPTRAVLHSLRKNLHPTYSHIRPQSTRLLPAGLSLHVNTSWPTPRIPRQPAVGYHEIAFHSPLYSITANV